jgi:hypothetical protein
MAEFEGIEPFPLRAVTVGIVVGIIHSRLVDIDHLVTPWGFET